MKRMILTGAPGSGKTAIVRLLEVSGYAVIEEAASDVIALEQARGVQEPWNDAAFVDAIVHLQRQRQLQSSFSTADTVFFDRSPVCTYALAMFLGRRVSPTLRDELERIHREQTYERRVCFVESLGFVTLTSARRIDSEHALRFAAVHVEAYQHFGYECVAIPKGTVEERLRHVMEVLRPA